MNHNLGYMMRTKKMIRLMNITMNMALMMWTITALEADIGGSEWNGRNNGRYLDEEHA